MAERLVLLDDDTGEIKDFIGEYRTQEQIEAQTKYIVNKEKQTFNSDFTWIVFEYGKDDNEYL